MSIIHVFFWNLWREKFGKFSDIYLHKFQHSFTHSTLWLTASTWVLFCAKTSDTLSTLHSNIPQVIKLHTSAGLLLLSNYYTVQVCRSKQWVIHYDKLQHNMIFDRLDQTQRQLQYNKLSKSVINKHRLSRITLSAWFSNFATSWLIHSCSRDPIIKVLGLHRVIALCYEQQTAKFSGTK